MDLDHFPHLRNKIYVYVWTSRQFQQEQVQWEDVNKVLRHHGFQSVLFADPVENKSLTDLVLLDKKSASDLRTTLKTMLSDSERRQALIQELVRSNNQLKEEVQTHVGRAAQQTRRVAELEGLLDQVKTRVQELEDRFLGSAAHEQLLRANRESQKRCLFLERKLSKQEEEVAQLRKKLQFAVREEEKRLAHRKATKCSSAADKQKTKGESEGQTPSLKTILKEQKESHSQIQELKREITCLVQELNTRPTLKEVKLYQHKLHHQEGPNKPRHPRICEDDNPSETWDESSLAVLYHQALTEISALVTNPHAPRKLHAHKGSPGGLELTEFQSLLPALEDWAQQIQLLRGLHCRINRLANKLLPWKPRDGEATETGQVEDMMVQVESLLKAVPDDQQQLRSPTPHTLGSMVAHFQKLFDVPALNGVYLRMNEVYTRLGEMTNAMRNLRDVLDIESKVSPTEVVNHVSRLVSSETEIYGLLGDAEIDSIIIKMKQHDEFFPAFHGIITEILGILEVSHLDQIVPALKSLKLTSRLDAK